MEASKSATELARRAVLVTQKLGTIWLKEGPGPFDTLETWERYLTATKSMPDCLQKSMSVQQARKAIAQKRKEAAATAKGQGAA